MLLTCIFLFMVPLLPVKSLFMFKNYGRNAGASLVHPHSQIVALPIIPLHVQSRLTYAQNYYAKYGACVMCTTVTEELANHHRYQMAKAKQQLQQPPEQQQQQQQLPPVAVTTFPLSSGTTTTAATTKTTQKKTLSPSASFTEAGGDRVLVSNGRFVAFVPFAATSPFSVWIVSLQHQHNFLQATEEVSAMEEKVTVERSE